MIKEMWNLLEATYKGAKQVKEIKINMLPHSYEIFKKKLDESIKDIFNRFRDIISTLEGLGNTYPNGELIKRF